MARQPALPEVGRIVEIMRGRDRGMYGIVLGFEGNRFLLLADGAKRKVENPKKKNARHVRNTSYLADEVAQALITSGKVPNAKLRHALNQHQLSLHGEREPEVERGLVDGER